ncbi:hypothetical protein [Comamonas aquatica]|uniref:hypothetical protein n=1 Tax=Comamonas aquatica TaxID=225991 RepID=UPI0012DE4B3B|nr:hypothetical protein [Comamonas aquatica]
MNLAFLQQHAEKLREFATSTAQRSAQEPANQLLKIAAKNQLSAARQAEIQLEEAKGVHAAQALEWRLIGQSTEGGAVPMGLLARLSDPLNKLLLRAAYFARNHEEPDNGTGEGFANEMNLKLAGLAEGSARLFIVGNTTPDMTGSTALVEGVEHLFATLNSGKDAAEFYSSLDGLGEMAADALHDVLYAIEKEECSVEVKWHANGAAQSKMISYSEVIHIRTLLKSTKDPEPKDSEIQGRVSLLSSTGRIQVLTASGEKINIKFKPKAQGEFVSAMRLGQAVNLPVSVTVFREPVSDKEIKRYKLRTVLN